MTSIISLIIISWQLPKIPDTQMKKQYLHNHTTPISYVFRPIPTHMFYHKAMGQHGGIPGKKRNFEGKSVVWTTCSCPILWPMSDPPHSFLFIWCSKRIPITIFMGEMQIVLAMSSCLLLKTKLLYGENNVMFLLLWMARAQSLLTKSTISVCFVCIVYTKTNWWFQPLREISVRLDHPPNYWGK